VFYLQLYNVYTLYKLLKSYFYVYINIYLGVRSYFFLYPFVNEGLAINQSIRTIL